MKSAQQVNPHVYLATYCLGFFVFGSLTGCMGPIIPFLSQERNKTETQYSMLFAARTFGAIITFLFMKYLHWTRKQPCEHKIISYMGFINSALMVLFISWSNDLGQFISFAVFGGGHYAILRAINICLLKIASEKAGIWMPLAHGMFGVGALSIPLLVNFVTLNVFYVMAALCFTFSAICFYLPAPTRSQSLLRSNLIQKYEHRTPTTRLQVIMGLAFFLTVGVELTASSWLPSYTVITGAMDKGNAAICGTFFWLTSTSLRFSMVFFKVKCSIKLRIFTSCLVMCSVICLIMHCAQQYFLNAIVGSLFFGASCSAIFPLLISIPIEFGMNFTKDQMSNLMFLPFMSSLFLTGAAGKFMEIDIILLFVNLLVSAVILWASTMVILKRLKYEQEKPLIKKTEQKKQVLIEAIL